MVIKPLFDKFDSDVIQVIQLYNYTIDIKNHTRFYKFIKNIYIILTILTFQKTLMKTFILKST